MQEFALLQTKGFQMLLDGYIRVSQVGGRKGDRFISPSVQREQVEAWSASNNAVLGEVFEELNESGGRADRPLLEAAIERVERKESDGVIVARLDRFGRSLFDGLGAIKRIEEAGGTFVSVTDGIDLRTATGKLVMRILFSIGEWEFERVRTNWDIARGRAVERGLYICRKAPIGYRRAEDGRLRINPAEAAIVREVFALRQRGLSFDSLAGFLNDSELETELGGPFTGHTVHKMIRNTGYRGEARSGPHRNPDAHEPIVDAATWQACQRIQRGPRHWVQGLVSGLIRCGACGRMMSATRPQGKSSRFNVYRCCGHSGECSERAHVRNDEIDPLIEEFIFRVCCRREPANSSELAVEKCEAAIEVAEESLIAYRDNPRLLRTLGAESFEAGIATRRRTLERKLLELARARRSIQRPRVEVEGLEERWPQMSWVQRREVVGEFIDCVVVARGSEPAIERAWVFRRGRGPFAAEPLEFKSLMPLTRSASRLRAHRSWPRERLRKELGAFFAERTVWPHYLEFADAGKARLHAQTMAWGGPHFWGAKLEVKVPRRIERWNEIRLRGALAPFLEGREAWPQLPEFEAAGMMAVYRAVRSGGGTEHWAEEFGLSCKTKRKLWSKERIEPLLIAFLDGRDSLPSMKEFGEAGNARLYSALHSHGGTAYWTKRLNLRVVAGPLDRRAGAVKPQANGPRAKAAALLRSEAAAPTPGGG